MTIRPRFLLLLIGLCAFGAIVDLHNAHVSTSIDEAHDRSIVSLQRSVESLTAVAVLQKERIDKLQLIVDDQADRIEDQADQLLDVDKRLQTFERNEEKVCEEKW